MAKKELFSRKWVCTDPDTNQYGRQLSDTLYEFKEDGKEPTIIDLADGIHEFKEIEHCINAYGYTLLCGDNKNDKLQNIKEVFGHSTQWIIAECLFESN